jgi:endogenous inhibitor of DNA gyrase (YacG/DUF329 family)
MAKSGCPICGKPLADLGYRPFCSKRCADVDLHRWLSEGYAVPGGAEVDDGDGASMPADADQEET